jgi:hypothetical protein
LWSCTDRSEKTIRRTREKLSPALLVWHPKRRFGGSETGFGNVADYRLYDLDGVNRVASGVWIEADDDQAAIAIAETRMNGGGGGELWLGRRLVARIARKRGPGEQQP